MYLYNYVVFLLRVSVLQVSRSSFQIGISHPSITMENSLFENTRQLSACLHAKPQGQRDNAIRDLSDGHPRPRAMLQDIHVGLLSPSHRRRLEYHKDLILVRRQLCRFMVVVGGATVAKIQQSATVMPSPLPPPAMTCDCGLCDFCVSNTVW